VQPGEQTGCVGCHEQRTRTFLPRADLAAMAPGVSAALITTVAGLLVAIPSMFGYNWLVHNLRVLMVELDNFAQELVSKMETEYLDDDDA